MFHLNSPIAQRSRDAPVKPRAVSLKRELEKQVRSMVRGTN